MEQPLISVIVPVYKVEDYICQSLESILNQSYSNLEVILVDDGSPDKCPDICDSFAARDKRVTVIHETNGGPGAARNAALDVVTGDYIAFVDSDDWLEPEAYEVMIKFAQDRNLDIVYCVPNEIEHDKVSGSRYHYFPDRTVCDAREILFRTLKNEISAETWLKLCRRHCWDGIRFPEGRIYEDVAISHLLLEKAENPVGFLDKPLYNYRINPAGLTQTRAKTSRYHFFLSLKERYEYAVKKVPEAEDKARVLAARFAMGTYLDCRAGHWTELEPCMPEVTAFLQREKGMLLKSAEASRNEKLSLLLYYYARPVFSTVYRLYISIRRNRGFAENK